MGCSLLRRLALVAFMMIGVVVAGCDGSSSGTEFVVKAARFGKWEDKRSSGSIIMHDMLILEEPREFGSQGAPLGFYVVTTQGTMAGKIDGIVTDKIPSMRGMRMHFAVGNPVEVRVEKVVDGGKRVLVHEGRASYLEVTR